MFCLAHKILTSITLSRTVRVPRIVNHAKWPVSSENGMERLKFPIWVTKERVVMAVRILTWAALVQWQTQHTIAHSAQNRY